MKMAFSFLNITWNLKRAISGGKGQEEPSCTQSSVISVIHCCVSINFNSVQAWFFNPILIIPFHSDLRFPGLDPI